MMNNELYQGKEKKYVCDVDVWMCHSSEIATRISEVLIEKKLRQKDLAMMIGLRPQQVSRILRGNVNLTIKTIARIEMALDVKLLKIAGREYFAK